MPVVGHAITVSVSIFQIGVAVSSVTAVDGEDAVQMEYKLTDA